MTMKKLILCAVLVPFLAGCAGVPEGRIVFNPRTGQTDVRSPKNVHMTNVTVKATTNGYFSLEVGGFSSVNDPSVIESAGAADAQRMKGMIDLLNVLIQLSKTAAATAAAPTP